jgi:hypothetical protein
MTPEELDHIEDRAEATEFITRADVVKLVAEVRRLRKLTNMVLALFYERGPQDRTPRLRTPWIATQDVEQWRRSVETGGGS